ncbi:hypothetical protein RRG08_043150 [Elysia crispata]|uniref:Transmembrane protein n=1 Tax=Elysia crispata TaxID=231223 RepID=A0AAE1A6V3_9GAST|nr:hypothetical protein RRG08_043150 [Elysia crispata]
MYIRSLRFTNRSPCFSTTLMRCDSSDTTHQSRSGPEMKSKQRARTPRSPPIATSISERELPTRCASGFSPCTPEMLLADTPALRSARCRPVRCSLTARRSGHVTGLRSLTSATLKRRLWLLNWRKTATCHPVCEKTVRRLERHPCLSGEAERFVKGALASFPEGVEMLGRFHSCKASHAPEPDTCSKEQCQEWCGAEPNVYDSAPKMAAAISASLVVMISSLFVLLR